MHLWRWKVVALYAAAALAFVCCAVAASVALAPQATPHAAGNSSEGPPALCPTDLPPCPAPAAAAGTRNAPPVVESHKLAGHPYSAVFNPSVVGNVAPLARCPERPPVVVLYRDVDLSHGLTKSYVSLHVWRPPAAGFAGRMAEFTPSPVVRLNVTDALQGTGKCSPMYTGYEDPRGLVTSDGTLLVFVNNMRPSDCRRRLNIVRVPLAEATGAAGAEGTAPRAIEVPSVTWLTFTERQEVEKNWVPFAEGPQSTVVVTFSLEPHVVISCPTQGDSVKCEQVASTSWPQLGSLGARSRAAMHLWRWKVVALYAAAALAFATRPRGPPALCPTDLPPCPAPAAAAGTRNAPPVVESHKLAGHPYSAVFNPSVVGNVAPLARCPERPPVVVLYRDVDLSHGLTKSYVSLHVWRPPAAGFAGRMAEFTPSPVVRLNVTDALQGTGKCSPMYTGYEDPRGLVTSDGTLLVFVNNMRPSDCRRRLNIVRVPLAEATGAAGAEGTAPRAIEVPSVTWLTFTERQEVEKNWVPFAEGPQSTVVVTFSLEPHVVISCPTQGDSVKCEQVASTSWPQLGSLVGSHGKHLRPSNVPVWRRDHGDYIAVGHWRQGYDVSFFFYTFQGTAPYALTGASEAFSFDYADKWQYISGLALVGDYYVATFSIHDATTQTATWPRCEVDGMVRRFKRAEQSAAAAPAQPRRAKFSKHKPVRH
eukprot:m51a1_g2382 hypothetical protein (705) ;mRNA; r:700880-703252